MQASPWLSHTLLEMAKHRRHRWEVAPSKVGFGWQVTKDGNAVQFTFRKAAAVALAVELCNAALDNGERSELVIKGRDGKIADSRTYGDDPRKTKG